MINRILIRIKVIQILYSFLLVEKHFSLERNPSAPTKEKRFAYALYIDMIILMIRIAESVKIRRDATLMSTRFISRLLIDETVKAALASSAENFPFNNLVDSLAEKVKESAIFKNYKKTSGRDDRNPEADLWPDIFKLIIMADPAVVAAIEARTNYTFKGMERMSDMMGRTFVNFLTAQDNVREVEDALDHSLDEARDLYFRFLTMPIELTDLQERILDDNRHKFLKSDEDINPNLRFVENEMVRILKEDPRVEEYMRPEKDGKPSGWAAEDPILFRKLLDAVLASEDYAEYMEAPSVDLTDDCELWRNLFKRVILENSMMLQALEDKSVFWNDDVDIISTFVLKSFRRVAESQNPDLEEPIEPVFDKFKDEEDARFGRELVRALYREKDLYRRYINEALDEGRWDKDRLAFMDIVIMMAALAEILNFPKIPLQASVNEYIEIAKSYSSNKSGAFVNGVLGSVINRLRKEGLLLKN